jgi:carbon monoxide dehydrogenase subunit G
MHKIEGSIEVTASPETVWSILADRENEFKFYPALVSHEIDPPGLAVLGQKSHAKAKIRGMKVETFTEIAELEPTRSSFLDKHEAPSSSRSPKL